MNSSTTTNQMVFTMLLALLKSLSPFASSRQRSYMYQAETAFREWGRGSYQTFLYNLLTSVCLVLFFYFVGPISYQSGYQRQADILCLVNLNFFFIDTFRVEFLVRIPAVVSTFFCLSLVLHGCIHKFFLQGSCHLPLPKPEANVYSQILANNQLGALFRAFIYFISLHVSNIKCSSSGDRIVLTHHLVWLVCVSDCLVCQPGGTSWPAYQAVTQTNHTRWCINTIRSPDDEHLMLETYREMK